MATPRTPEIDAEIKAVVARVQNKMYGAVLSGTSKHYQIRFRGATCVLNYFRDDDGGARGTAVCVPDSSLIPSALRNAMPHAVAELMGPITYTAEGISYDLDEDELAILTAAVVAAEDHR